MVSGEYSAENVFNSRDLKLKIHKHPLTFKFLPHVKFKTKMWHLELINNVSRYNIYFVKHNLT